MNKSFHTVARSAVLAVSLLAGCTAAQEQLCDFEGDCPEADGGFVIGDACEELGDGAPCATDASAGFCRAGVCESAVSVQGVVASHQSGLPTSNASVVIAGDPTSPGTLTSADGAFELEMLSSDSLALEINAGSQFMPLRTRELAVDGLGYIVNGTKEAPTLMFSTALIDAMLDNNGFAAGPRTAIIVRVGRIPGKPLAEAKVGLFPDRGQIVYFDGLRQPQPARPFTSVNSGLAVIIGVEPGSYLLSANHPGSAGCVSAGSDPAATVSLEVTENAVTDAGWLVCAE